MTQDRADVKDDGTGEKTIGEGEHTPEREVDADPWECLIVEIGVSPDALPLGETLSRLDVRVDFEQLVPVSETPLPYLWTSGGEFGTFEEAAAADPTVESIRRITTLNHGGLYELDWADPGTPLLEWLERGDGTLLQADGENDGWYLKLRVESRSVLGTLQDRCDEHGVELELIRLYRLTEPKMGQFDVSEKQFDALLTALELGYFEIPRDATLGDVADALGISKRAASERLRRGHSSLLHNTLVVGRPTGVGSE